MDPPTAAPPLPRNKQALLDAALRCLQKRGWAGTTARDLVAESGTNLGAIGYHFGSKDALLNAALVEGCQRWFGELAGFALAAGPTPPEARLRRVAGEIEGSFKRNRGLAVSYFEALAQAERSPEVRRALAACYENGREALAALIEEQFETSGADARALAAVLFACFDGLLIQWLLDPRRTPSGSEIFAALETIGRAMASREPRRSKAEVTA
jgi:AcrR family transcriptional regulator